MKKERFLDTDYDIYEDGRCFSHKTNKFLTAGVLGGYLAYNLTYPDGKKRRTKVHRMLALTYIPNPENKPIVNHKDGNKLNNNLDNLEWVTNSENTQHAVETGLKPASKQNAIYYTDDLEGEEWKDIVEAPLYRISSKGRIMNKQTKRLLKPDILQTGYAYVNLYINKKQNKRMIHTLVYKTFYDDKLEDSYVINHKDGNKLNNEYTNLEKITRTENNLHAVYEIQSNKSNKPVNQYTLDGVYVATYPSAAEAKRITGASKISKAARGEQHSSGGFIWKYVEDDNN